MTSMHALGDKRCMVRLRLVTIMLPRPPGGRNLAISSGLWSAPSNTSNHSCLILSSQRETECTDSSTRSTWASGWRAMSWKLCFMVSAVVASSQKTRQKLEGHQTYVTRTYMQEAHRDWHSS